MLATGLGLLALEGYHLFSGTPLMNEAAGQSTPASREEYAIVSASALFCLLFGAISLLVALRAEVVVDPWGITAFGIGMKPSFRVAWSEIDEVTVERSETADILRLRAGRRKLSIPMDIPDFGELRSFIAVQTPHALWS